MGVWVCNQVDTGFHNEVERMFLVMHVGFAGVYSCNVSRGVFWYRRGVFWYIWEVLGTFWMAFW